MTLWIWGKPFLNDQVWKWRRNDREGVELIESKRKCPRNKGALDPSREEEIWKPWLSLVTKGCGFCFKATLEFWQTLKETSGPWPIASSGNTLRRYYLSGVPLVSPVSSRRYICKESEKNACMSGSVTGGRQHLGVAWCLQPREKHSSPPAWFRVPSTQGQGSLRRNNLEHKWLLTPWLWPSYPTWNSVFSYLRWGTSVPTMDDECSTWLLARGLGAQQSSSCLSCFCLFVELIGLFIVPSTVFSEPSECKQQN